ncbi:hypothetical protein HK101_010964 [Irineochytrium annulatum]|nr:hypothetical protein HK101_010964 [Irineochytrium annulatum]
MKMEGTMVELLDGVNDDASSVADASSDEGFSIMSQISAEAGSLESLVLGEGNVEYHVTSRLVLRKTDTVFLKLTTMDKTMEEALERADAVSLVSSDADSEALSQVSQDADVVNEENIVVDNMDCQVGVLMLPENQLTLFFPSQLK